MPARHAPRLLPLTLGRPLGVALGCIVLLAASPAASVRSDPGFVIVVHAGNHAAAMPREQIARLFLRKLKQWPDGALAEPVDLAPNDAVRDAFTHVVLGKSIASVRAYWQQRLFSGAEVPPPEKASEADVLEFVRTHPAGAGYVSSRATLPPGVRTLDVER